MPIRAIPTPKNLPDPALIPEAPKAVLEAAKAARERGDILEAAKAELAEAKAAVPQAEAADTAADRKALASNDTLPGPKAGPKAREAVAAAERKVEAAEGNFQEAAGHLAETIKANAEEWKEAIEHQREKLADVVVGALEEYGAARAQLRFLTKPGQVDAFDSWNPWSGGAFNHSPRVVQRLVPHIEHEREEGEKRLRQRRQFDLNHYGVSIGQVLAELEYMALGVEPWNPDTMLIRTAADRKALLEARRQSADLSTDSTAEAG